MKNNLIYLAAALVSAGVPFLFMPLLTRILTPEEYGLMNLSMTIYSIFVPVISLGLPAYIYRQFFESNNVLLKTFELSLTIVLKWSALVSALAITFYLFIPNLEQYSKELSLFVLMLLGAVSQTLFTCRIQLFNAMNKPFAYLIFQVSYVCAMVITTLILLFTLEQGAYSRVEALIMADVLFGSICYLSIKAICSTSNTLKNETGDKNGEITLFLKFGLGLMPHQISSILLSSIDKFIITVYLGLGALGAYAVSVQFCAILMVVSQGISKEWSRFFFSHPYHPSINKKLLMYMGIIWVTSIALYLLKDIFYYIFVGGQLRGGVEVIGILLLAQFFHCNYMLLTQQITYNRQTYILSICTVLSVAINLLLSLIWIKSYGLVGVAWATCIGMFSKFVFSAFYFIYTRRNKGLPIEKNNTTCL